MDRPIELTPLLCVRCNTSVPAEIEETAWVCGNCGQGLALDEEAGLVGIKVQFSTKVPDNTPGKPYWVVDGKVRVDRQTYGFGKANKEADELWAVARRFFVPAYTCTLEEMLENGRLRFFDPPPAEEGKAAQFEPPTLMKKDVRAAVEFIVVAIEASRKDKLRQVLVELELGEVALWVLPQ